MGRTFPYPKIFLKRPKYKPGMYSIKKWCDHRKMKIAATRELNGLIPEMGLFYANWAKWKEFKALYKINGASLRNLGKEHASVLKLNGNKRSKKIETDPKKM